MPSVLQDFLRGTGRSHCSWQHVFPAIVGGQTESAIAEVRVVIERMYRRCRLGEHVSKRRDRSRSRAVSSHGRCIDQCAWHPLPHRSGRACGHHLVGRHRNRFDPFLSAQPSKEPAQQRSALGLQSFPLSFFGKLANASSLRLRLLAFASIGLVKSCLRACAPAAALRPPIPKPLDKPEAEGCPFPRRVEGERRR